MISEEFSDSVPSFSVDTPADQRVPYVFNSPHSGRIYPPSFLRSSKLDCYQIRGSEDFHVDDLFQDVVRIGAPLAKAHFPRAYLDANREPYELDDKLFGEKLPPYTNKKSVRVACGLGTIARVIAESQEIYREKPTLDEALARVENIYRPYHENLRHLLAQTHVRFGYSVLVDCHSMPSSAVTRTNRGKPDIIIGDRFGTSCSFYISMAIAEIFKDLGLSVVRNKPYAGGFITEHYGRPNRGLHAVQIEINRGLYMDEKRLVLTSGFDQLRAQIAKFAERLVSIPDASFYPDQQAAE